VVALFDADNYKLRNNAVALAYDLADLRTDLVEPAVDDIAAFLTVEDTRTRINATGTLARVADDFPESVAHLTPTFVELLSDDDHLVRSNACWALGYLRASEAQSALEERLQDETNETVRSSITWALSEIDTV
jgi:HEAT repeat.